MLIKNLKHTMSEKSPVACLLQDSNVSEISDIVAKARDEQFKVFKVKDR